MWTAFHRLPRASGKDVNYSADTPMGPIIKQSTFIYMNQTSFPNDEQGSTAAVSQLNM